MSRTRISRAEVRDLQAKGQSILREAMRLHTAVEDRARDVRTAYGQLEADALHKELLRIPVDSLSGGGLRIQALKNHGVRSVAQVRAAGPHQLAQVPGVGERTAQAAVRRAEEVAANSMDSLSVRISGDASDTSSSAVLQSLRGYMHAKQAQRTAGSAADVLIPKVSSLLDGIEAGVSWWRITFGGRALRAQVAQSASELQQVLQSPLARAIQDAGRVLDTQDALADVVNDYRKHAPRYYALLEQVIPSAGSRAKQHGALSEELIASARGHHLDLSLMRPETQLRGYQVFGAQYALEQKKVLIGDEMGVGKTLQALAVACHLQSSTHGLVLVVCPASVLMNWEREVKDKTTLPVRVLHGSGRDLETRGWLTNGGLAVTTFETARVLPLPSDLQLQLLIVDEAHMARNPEARRSQFVKATAQRASRVVFLTGTPMDNRVEEFQHLVRMLQPSVAHRLTWSVAAAGSVVFRRAAAPVYLRRNQEDVLNELPRLVEIEDWERFTAADRKHYRLAVEKGNLMAMRRAAFLAEDSAKMERLLEIAGEANANGRKVLVFSYFLDVLRRVHQELGKTSVGVMTGAVAPAERQRLVDDFTASSDAGVLVSQITAGGVGLNIQAASVVILCEPQYVPSMESQAIARAHRMGQVETVQVHRLLAADSVDQRVLEILGRKEKLFDQYARYSYVAQTQEAARNGSVAAMDQLILQAERQRLGIVG